MDSADVPNNNCKNSDIGFPGGPNQEFYIPFESTPQADGMMKIDFRNSKTPATTMLELFFVRSFFVT
jgi:hypothetical protein